jgi:hypothetical protein
MTEGGLAAFSFNPHFQQQQGSNFKHNQFLILLNRFLVPLQHIVTIAPQSRGQFSTETRDHVRL